MGERLSPRDVFDVWFFLNVLHAGINENIIREARTSRRPNTLRGVHNV